MNYGSYQNVMEKMGVGGGGGGVETLDSPPTNTHNMYKHT